MLATISALTAATLAAPVAGLLGYRQLKRTRLAAQLRISTPNGIDESGFVRINGLDTWVSIRGEDLRNPVILEIHGGPGASNLIHLPRTRSWERHFTIVRWDMRGAGFTFANAPEGQGELTLDQLQRDALEVTRHVRERLGVDRLLIVANSFGSILGLRLARSHPELYSAYVGTDQNVIAGGRERTAYDALVRRLRAAGKKKQLATVLEAGARPEGPTVEQIDELNKLFLTTDPLSYDTMKTVVVRSLWFSPLHTLRGLRSSMKAMHFSLGLQLQARSVDEWAEGTEFQIPFFVFQGDGDVLTPPESARRLFDDVTAPVKDFALIRDASHFAGFRHPEQFLDLMLTRVRPAIASPVAC
ncbi:alpha/beta fold hydrolase [Streptomyces sp. NRRL WC-3742]|uniref:alpha/beta fold hydrolase n=1 Tax=Streptomyces sp. NRRL WC-3742 TaxID=1463934 RepID=UPI0004C783BC|nr:alpha/beta hydrolase [Streptomyces sp. NRRL WC-3742]